MATLPQWVEARVIQKIATEAEWNEITLVPYKGEVCLVGDSGGKVVNIKIGDGINTFPSLNYMFDSIQQNVGYIAIESNALPTPEGDVAWGMVTAGTYTFGGSDVFTVPDGHWGIANYSSGAWSLVDMGELPESENKIPDWSAGSYTIGQQVNHLGYLWRVKVSETNQEPTLGSDDWEFFADITPKVHSANVAFGVADNTPEKNIPLYLDNDGKTHFDARKSARLGIENIRDQEVTDKFDLAQADNTPEKNVIHGIKDGKIWTKNGWIDPKVVNEFISNYEPSPVSKVDTLPPDFSNNGIYNQWVEPMAASIGDMSFFTSVGKGNELYLHRKDADGFIHRRIIGVTESDDHNNAAILLDTRVGAEYPIMIFHANHQTTVSRYCRLTSLEPNDWNNIEWINLSDDNVSYSQAFRNGDEIIVHTRTGTYQVGGLNTRGIRWYYSTDNGSTWVNKIIFERPGHTQPYLQIKEKLDKSGLNIAINSHPEVYDYTGIRFITLDWASGSMSAFVGDTPIVSNFRDIFTNPSWIPLDQYSVGLEVLPHNTDMNRTRLLDVTDNSTGETRIVYAFWPTNGDTMQAFRDSVYRVIDFNISTGVINFNVSLGEVGMPLERPAGSNLYIGGACFIGNREVIMARYRNKSYLEGGTDIVSNDGHTDFRISRVHSPTNIIEFDNVLGFRGKGGRPYKSADGNLLMICQMDSYLTYTNYTSNIRVYNLINIKSWE